MSENGLLKISNSSYLAKVSIRLRRVDRLRRHRLAAVLAGNQSLEGAVVVLGGDQFLERVRNRNGETQVVTEGDIASHGKIMIMIGDGGHLQSWW